MKEVKQEGDVPALANYSMIKSLAVRNSFESSVSLEVINSWKDRLVTTTTTTMSQDEFMRTEIPGDTLSSF